MDIEKYNKFGENDFIRWCDSKHYLVEDVSNDIEFKVSGIDYVISKKAIPPKYLMVNNILSIDYNSRDYYKVVIMVDNVGYNNRGVKYGVIEDDITRCLSNSKADFVYYVFVEENVDGIVIKKEAWYVNLSKWKKYILDKFFDGRTSMEECDKVWGIKRDNVDIGGLLCNVDKLREQGIAKKIY